MKDFNKEGRWRNPKTGKGQSPGINEGRGTEKGNPNAKLKNRPNQNTGNPEKT